MIAETLRELGVLAFVFGAMDGLEYHQELAKYGMTPVCFTLILLGVFVLLLGGGIILEAKRKS